MGCFVVYIKYELSLVMHIIDAAWHGILYCYYSLENSIWFDRCSEILKMLIDKNHNDKQQQ